jgi:hypothetical protein
VIGWLVPSEAVRGSAAQRTRTRFKEDFLDQIAAPLHGVEPIHRETAARAVFEVPERNIDRRKPRRRGKCCRSLSRNSGPGNSASR